MRAGLFQYDPQPGVVPPGSITNSELADMPALSVKANATNATASPQDVTSTTNDTLFRRIGNALSWGNVTDGMLTTNSVSLSKLINASAQYRLIGRKTAGAGSWEECTPLELLLPQLNVANTFSGGNQTNLGSWVALGENANVANVIRRNQNNAAGPSMYLMKTRGTTDASPVIVNTNDNLGNVEYYGYDGSANRSAANLFTQITEATPGPAAFGSRVTLEVVPAGSGTASTVQRWDHTLGLQAFGANTFLDTNRLFRLRVYTVATLPAAGTAGRRAAVSNALAPTYGAAVAGGGAVNIPVYDNGAAWVTA